MKLLILGSRKITDFDLSPYVSNEVDTIITGGAKGVDCLAERYADLHRLSKYIIRPQYNIYGRAAPILRNELMVNIADEVLIIWDGHSKGTLRALKYSEKTNKPMRVIIV